MVGASLTPFTVIGIVIVVVSAPGVPELPLSLTETTMESLPL